MVKTVLLNLAGVFVSFAVFGIFVGVMLDTPVMEVSAKTHECLRVIASDGQKIKNGCEFARKGMIATEHRYVAW